MDVAGYLSAARRWWLLILLATALGGVAGWLGSSGAERTYEAQARLLVGPINADFDTIRAAGELAQTYASIATSEAVLAGAASATGGSPAEIGEQVSARADTTARVVTIRAQAGDPGEAAALANAVGTSLRDFTAGAVARPEGELTVVDPALAPTSAVAPQVGLIALLAALGALLAAIIVVALIELLDDSVRSLADIRRITERPVAGLVPIHDGSSGGLLAADPSSRAAGAYRGASGVLPVSFQRPSAVVVSDADGGRYSDEITTNLAAAVMANGIPVRLVDAREDRPMREAFVDELAVLAPSIRRPDVRARAPLLEVVRGTSREALDLLTSMDAERDEDDGRGRGSLTLINVGDVRMALGARSWTTSADAVVIAAVIGHTQRRALGEAVERLTATSHVRPVILAARREGTRLGRGLPKVAAPEPQAPVRNPKPNRPAR